MDKETLLKICNAVYEEGFNIGYDWGLLDEGSHPTDIYDLLAEIRGYGYPNITVENLKAPLKKSRIEKVLKKFGVNTDDQLLYTF